MQTLPSDDQHIRPDNTSDKTVEAVGKVSEALERLERARGSLYDFHQLIGGTDMMLDDAIKLLREAGHDTLADQLETEIIGRNVLEGRWTFQIVEEFDDGYYSDFKAMEKKVRDELMNGRRHVFESELKESRRTHGRDNHEARP